jgi:hypothetical protein
VDHEEGISIRQSCIRRHDKSSSNVSGGLQHHNVKQKDVQGATMTGQAMQQHHHNQREDESDSVSKCQPVALAVPGAFPRNEERVDVGTT